MKPQARRRALAPVPDDARQFAVPMRDGVLLATDVYLPEGRAQSNVVLSRLPYDKDGDEFFMPTVARYWVGLGYAVVVQDVRGKGRSGGEFLPDESDADDGYDTIEWIVRQPWALGRVAMIGDSYAGFTQWTAAASRHPALVAITPRCAAHDRTAQRFVGGVLALETSVYWAAETAVDEYLYDYPEPFDWTPRPIAEVVTREVGSRRPRWIDGWAVDDRVYESEVPAIDPSLPVLHVCGLFDHGVVAHYRTWELARTAYPQHRLVLDAVDHSWRGLARAGVDEVLLENGPDFMPRYFAHIREFVETAFSSVAPEGGIVQWRPALDVPWRWAETWPPPESSDVTLWAAVSDRGGELALRPPDQERIVTWVHDPADPVPSRGFAFHELAQRHDLTDLAGRPDVFQFLAEPVGDTLELAGHLRFHATVTSSSPHGMVVVTLLDVTPEGLTWEVRTGRARIADGETTVDLGPVAYQFLPGHRLGVRICSSLFPRLALDSGGESNTWETWDPVRSTQSVALGGLGGARVSCSIWDATVGAS